MDRPLSIPGGRPHTTFVHDSRAVCRSALGGGLIYALITGLSVMLPSVILAVSARAYWLALVMVIVLPVFVILPATALVLWMGEGHIEYRLYENDIVAYDTDLDSAQWVARGENVRSVSVTDPTPQWRSSLSIFPNKTRVLRIDRQTGDSVVLQHLIDPDGFERAYRND